MNSLFPPWNLLDEVLTEIEKKPGERTTLNIRAGLPYFCLRLALLGKSTLLISEENDAETFSEDAQGFKSALDSLKDWSCGFLPENTLDERSALLEEGLQSKGVIWSGTSTSVMESTPGRDAFLNSRLILKAGKNLPYSILLDTLARQGYGRVSVVENEGEFAVRGEIIDFWSPNSQKPIRLVFLNDVIESLHVFDPYTQRTVSFIPETVILPLSWQGIDSGVFEHLPKDTVLIVDQNSGNDMGHQFPMLEISSSGKDLGLSASPPVSLNWKLFQKELKENSEKGIASFVLCRNTGETQRLEDILDDLGCGEIEMPQILIAPLSRGFYCESLKICVWSFGELSGTPRSRGRIQKYKGGRPLDFLTDIKPSDYIVHEAYGIGKYRGLERVKLKAGSESEFLNLEYKGGDRLLVPIQDFRCIQKFLGAEGKRPKLNSLDGYAWEKMKSKVREEIAELAGELLRTEALRASTVRAPVEDGSRPEEDRIYREFVDAFPYEETPDQSAAIKDIEKDMESSRLMDRLVCGDVGYGKTEIAMRAAFKAVCGSTQVAVLVPTTILAEQHHKTFEERFAAFPVRIEMISRFQTTAKQKTILQDLKSGLVDIIIGTHRLIQSDVGFKNLGLLVIDEEHRFGVQQKESLKKFKATADVLSLSATPIPRTLSLAMGGVRDISTIETPPEGRQPIETYVGSFDEDKLREATERELARGGQIFYVHNRIATIESRRQSLKKFFPRLRIGLAHGRMTADALEKAMWNFLNREWDVLLSTTIIESGLDIPNVNSLIVEDSDEFGLAQLYQLRGRVGRQREKAYCYLFFSDWSHLPEDARKRLTAIQEFSALGSGMKLALRDLEIRGTGNLLGPQQHGWINAVGLDLYCQLLSEEMKCLRKGEAPAPERPAPEIELNVSAFIPEEYVDSAGERISLYKKLIASKTEEELESLKSEFADRFGPLPIELERLFRMMSLKFLALKTRVSSITQTDKGIILGWNFSEENPPVDLPRFANERPDLIQILTSTASAGEEKILRILFHGRGIENDPISSAEKFLQISSKYVILNR